MIGLPLPCRQAGFQVVGRVSLNKFPPLCRHHHHHHHHREQAQGWRLEQPEPGVLIWHTSVGRVYTIRLDCPAADAGYDTWGLASAIAAVLVLLSARAGPLAGGVVPTTSAAWTWP
jgi:hypothetical protein